MARTHDFITPRLWGSPWFEKPPLLYWMTSLGDYVHLGLELSGRLPVAVLSLAFLIVMFFCLRREFGVTAAASASVLLATSAGWIAYSSLALTDLPLAVFYSLAIFLALPLVNDDSGKDGLRAGRFVLIGVCLGLATLAKALVPIALAIPFLWYLRQWWRSWALAICAGAAVALPWYAMMYIRNGDAFLQVFFWKQQFERLYSPSLQHIQPWWYYFPVILAALYPWTPLFALCFLQRKGWDERHRFLISCLAFGFFLFSVSLNKLPGYLLPLLPAAFVLLGCSVAQRRFAGSLRGWLVACARTDWPDSRSGRHSAENSAARPDRGGRDSPHWAYRVFLYGCAGGGEFIGKARMGGYSTCALPGSWGILSKNCLFSGAGPDRVGSRRLAADREFAWNDLQRLARPPLGLWVGSLPRRPLSGLRLRQIRLRAAIA